MTEPETEDKTTAIAKKTWKNIGQGKAGKSPTKNADNKMATKAEILGISNKLQLLRIQLSAFFEDFQILSAKEPEMITKFEKYIFQTNVLIHVFQRIHQGNFNDN